MAAKAKPSDTPATETSLPADEPKTEPAATVMSSPATPAPSPAATVTPLIQPSKPVLRQNALKPAEFAQTHWLAEIEVAASFERVLEPDYWANHTSGTESKLKPFDIITIKPADLSWFAELIVLDATRGAARVHVLRHVKLQEIAREDTVIDGYLITFRGPQKWSVVRQKDGHVLIEGQPLKSDAVRYAREHLKAFK